MFYPYCQGCHLPQSVFQQYRPICRLCLQRLKIRAQSIETPIEGIERLYYLYDSISSNHEILKSWKKSGSITLQKKLFPHSILVYEVMQELNFTGIDLILPIPQNMSHLKNTGCMPTFEFAEYISRMFSIPVCTQTLTLQNFSISKKSLGRLGRSLSANPFVLNRKLPAQVLVVDDFYTTGTTLSQAASCIQSHSQHTLTFGFTLGYRPNLF